MDIFGPSTSMKRKRSYKKKANKKKTIIVIIMMTTMSEIFFLSNATTCPLWTSWPSLLGMAGV